MIKQIVVGVCSTNCYLFYDKYLRCVIIDPGDNEVEIISNIKSMNLTPVGIVLTHGHFDHTAALGKIREYYQKKGTDLKTAIHAEDRKYLGESGEKLSKQFLSFLELNENTKFFDSLTRLPEADILLKESERVFNMDLNVIETPGHTKGSICLFSEDDGILFSGDTLFYRGIGRTDFPDGNSQNLINSIKKKLFTLPKNTKVYPGHGPATNIMNEEKYFIY